MRNWSRSFASWSSSGHLDDLGRVQDDVLGGARCIGELECAMKRLVEGERVDGDSKERHATEPRPEQRRCSFQRLMALMTDSAPEHGGAGDPTRPRESTRGDKDGTWR